MNVLWASHRDIENPAAGGAEKTAFQVASHLVARGHRVTLRTLAWPGCKETDVLDGVRIIRRDGLITSHGEALVSESLLKEADILVDDLAHVLPWFPLKTFDKPLLVFFHHLHARTLPGQVRAPLAIAMTLLERFYPLFYTRRQFVTESSTSVSDLTHMGIRPAQISVIRPGVNSRLFCPRPKARVPTIVHFSGLRPYKRPDHALEVVRNLLHKGVDVKLIMVGPEHYSKPLQDSAMDIADKVEFPGRLSEASLAEVVGQSWVHLYCSRSEGFGLSALEAAACEVPTVGYAVPGLIDSVRSGETGILVPDGNLTELTAATLSVLSEPNRYSTACRLYADALDIDKVAEEWERLLLSVARRQKCY
jgi:glycosyltransferase involved in cell wall biosynthesis